MLKLVLIPQQGFGSEAKTRGGILEPPRIRTYRMNIQFIHQKKKAQFVQTVGPITSRCSGKWARAQGKSSLFNGVAE